MNSEKDIPTSALHLSLVVPNGGLDLIAPPRTRGDHLITRACFSRGESKLCLDKFVTALPKSKKKSCPRPQQDNLEVSFLFTPGQKSHADATLLVAASFPETVS